MAKSSELKAVLTSPVVSNNPIALQILGVCSALAVTSKLETAFVMTLAVLFGNRFFESVYFDDPSSYPEQCAYYRADGYYRLTGYFGGSGVKSICICDF